MTEPSNQPPERRQVVDDIRNLLSALDGLAPMPTTSNDLRNNLEAFFQAGADRSTLELTPIGSVESVLRSPTESPKQGSEGAPDAWLVIKPEYAAGLGGLKAGDQLILLTWLDRADRTVLQVHPRDDLQNPLTGVFRTRSADRPNPIGLHPVTLRHLQGNRLLVGPLEAVDGTPVLDLKPVI